MRATLTVTFGFLSLVVTGCDSTTTPGAAPTAPTSVTGQATRSAMPPGAPAGLAGQTAAAAHAHHGAAAVVGARGIELKLTPEINQQLADLRKFVAPFHNFDKAVEYGYSIAAPGLGSVSQIRCAGEWGSTTRTRARTSSTTAGSI